jgi:hypothetical protein
MKYIGNYVNWVEQRWIDYMLNTEGLGYPVDFKDLDSHSATPMACSNRGLDTKLFVIYNKDITNFDISVPWSNDSYSEYWFVKLYPGMVQTIHQDELKNNIDGTRNMSHMKYWIPLQDYERGHAFIYEDTLITNYVKGDVFLYSDDRAFHCAGNMGYNTRLTLNIATWN